MLLLQLIFNDLHDLVDVRIGIRQGEGGHNRSVGIRIARSSRWRIRETTILPVIGAIVEIGRRRSVRPLGTIAVRELRFIEVTLAGRTASVSVKTVGATGHVRIGIAASIARIDYIHWGTGRCTVRERRSIRVGIIVLGIGASAVRAFVISIRRSIWSRSSVEILVILVVGRISIVAIGRLASIVVELGSDINSFVETGVVTFSR